MGIKRSTLVIKPYSAPLLGFGVCVVVLNAYWVLKKTSIWLGDFGLSYTGMK